MSPESLAEMERARAAWIDNPSASVPRIAHIIGVPVDRLEKWVERGHVIPGSVGDPELAKTGLGRRQVVVERVLETKPCFQERAKRIAPKKISITLPPVSAMEGDTSVEELRLMVKRKIYLMMDDPDSVAKYSAALKALDSVRKEEAGADEEDSERVRIYVPKESRSPGKP